MNTDYDSYRPKSSHGRANAGYRNKQIPVRQVTQSRDPPLRPKSSRGRNRTSHDTTHSTAYNPQISDPQARPKSSRGRHTRDSQISPDNVYQGYGTADNEPPARPKSSRGRPINNEHKTYYEPLKSDDGAYQSSGGVTEPARPKSSRGRPVRNTDADVAHSEGYEQTPSPSRRPRPKSAKGRSRTAPRAQPAYHYDQQQQSRADILVIDQSDSLEYGYPQETSTVPIHTSPGYGDPVQPSYGYSETYGELHSETQQIPYHYSDYQGPSHEEIPTADSPESEIDIEMHGTAGAPVHESPVLTSTFRPMSGRSSARPPTAAERKHFNEGAQRDNDFLRVATNTPMSARPDSASSFSRYNVLPSIGLKPVPAKRSSPTRIPSAYREPIQREDSASHSQTIPTSSIVTHNLQSTEPVLTESLNVLSMGDNVTSNTDTGGTPGGSKMGADTSSLLLMNTKSTSAKSGENSSQTLSGQLGQMANSLGASVVTQHQSSETAEQQTLSNINAKCGETAEKFDVPSFPALTREIRLPVEPKADVDCVLLAIKLPDGKRVQRYFHRSNTLETVLNFAEFSSKLDFTGTEIVCDAPRKVFSDLSMKLCDTGLENRTVIHIQIPDT